MPRLSMQIPHNLGRDEATRRIKESLAKVRDLVTELDEQWQGNKLTFHFKAMGFKVGGEMLVADTMVHVDLDLPLPAMMVKGKIEERVRQELSAVLALPQ
jgi:hypothetical protein